MMCQDYMVPLRELPEFLEFGNKECDIYPIWLCPCRDDVFHPKLNLLQLNEIYVDVGIYG